MGTDNGDVSFSVIFRGACGRIHSIPCGTVGGGGVGLPGGNGGGKLRGVTFLTSFQPEVCPCVAGFVTSREPVCMPPVLAAKDVMGGGSGNVVWEATFFLCLVGGVVGDEGVD